MPSTSIHRKIATLEQLMRAAAAAEDFEQAARLRNEIAHWKGIAAGGADETPLAHQPPPGAMGLGTHTPVTEPPKGWRRPKKPDPLTSNVKGRRR